MTINTREIEFDEIKNAVKSLCISSNKILPISVKNSIKAAILDEKSELGKEILQELCENIKAAEDLSIPVCQDTGLTVVFAEIGADVHIRGGLFEDAVNQGVREGYTQGFLRCSIVSDPIRRQNTGDNTPAIIHVKLVSGDKIKITVAPKGFGSENMSFIKMMNPSAELNDIKKFIVECVYNAGSNPCPPVIVGVGIGGNFEYCAYLAKKALCRDLNERNSDALYERLEEEILIEINKLGIGPQGFGGNVTALAVNIEKFPTHIAGLPIAVNLGCHVTRHESIVI